MAGTLTQEKTFAEANRDVTVLYKSGEDRFVFARPFTVDEQREVYDKAVGRIKRDYQGDEGLDILDSRFGDKFKIHFECGEGEYISGSNTKLLALINEDLEGEYWLPGFKEFKILIEEGKVSEGAVRDMGVGVFDSNGFIPDFLKRMANQCYENSWDYPILVPSRAYKLNEGGEVVLTDKADGVVYGGEAREIIDRDFDKRRGSNGVKSLFVSMLNTLCIDYYEDNMIGSNKNGMVDWICGAGTSDDLAEAVELDVRKEIDGRGANYERQIEKLEQKVKRLGAEKDREIKKRTVILES